MATKINQKEYLKKYLSNDVDDGTKKKKKKKSSKSAAGAGAAGSSAAKAAAVPASNRTNVRIIDDDIDIARLRPLADADLELAYAIGEEAPQIVGVVDDRPAELIASEDYKQSEKWKVLRNVDGGLQVAQLGSDGRVRRSGAVQTLDDDGERMARRRFTRYDSGEDDGEEEEQRDMNPKRAAKVKKATKQTTQNRRSRTPEDHSPVRRRERSPDQSPVRRRALASAASPDQSPVRRGAAKHRSRTPDRRAARPKQRSISPDQSPVRRRAPASPDQSPVRRGAATKHRSETPPDRRAARPQQRSISPDQSPVRRGATNHRSGTPDLSPVRQQFKRDPDAPDRRTTANSKPQKRADSPDQSPARRPSRRDRSRSRSPDRRAHRRRSRSRSPAASRRKRRTDTPDASPPRRTQIKREADIKREAQRSSDTPDVSPPRRGRGREASPAPRATIKTETSSTKPKLSRWSRDRSCQPPAPPPTSARMQHTLDGKRAGLLSASAMREESGGIRKREAAAYEAMSGEASGRGAEAVVRDRKTGRVRDVEAEMEVEHEKMRKELERKAVYDRWGKGVKQLEAHQSQRAEEQHEAAKPLARYADDEDRDALLRQRQHADDPMLEYVQQKRAERTAGQPAKPLYRGQFAENRFGLRPGYRWDGVDRSNGFEKRWFDVQSKSKATEEETYKYMTEDM